MARGILITFSGYPTDAACLMPDVGLASLAGTLLAHGHEVLVLDFNTATTLARLMPPALTERLDHLLPALAGEPDPQILGTLTELSLAMEERLLALSDTIAAEVATAVERQHAHFVGFKLWSGDGFVCCARVATSLRARFPELKLFGGGPAVMFAEETILAHTPAFDVLVDGEGEDAILGLAAYAEHGTDLGQVPNLIIRTPGGHVRTHSAVVADPDQLPFPSYDPAIYPSLTGDQQLNVFVLDDSRGCSNACRFCISRQGTGANWRSKSPARIVEELVRLTNRFGTSVFRLGGNSTPTSYLERFAAELDRRAVDVAYSAYTTVTGFSHGLDRIAASGCRTLFLGVESFVQDDLIRLNKTHTAAQSVTAVRTCIDAGVVPLVSLIIPAPGQSAAAIETNREAAIALCGDRPAVVIVQYAAILPRTDWWRRPQQYGFHLLSDTDAYRLRLASWKVRHIIPPTFWPPLPYTYDGMDFPTFSGVNARFQQQLASGGVVVNLSNEAMMMAAPSGHTPASLHAHLRRLIFTQDAAGIGAFIRTVNSGMRSARPDEGGLAVRGLRPGQPSPSAGAESA